MGALTCLERLVKIFSLKFIEFFALNFIEFADATRQVGQLFAKLWQAAYNSPLLTDRPTPK